MKAMILAAGEGTRLRPLTQTLPKPMIPIAGTPLLAHTLTWLSEQGVTEAAINLYHRPQAISDFFGHDYAGIRLHYFFEERLRGTAGGVKAAASLLQDAPFFVIYGDNLINADLRRLAAFHAEHGGLATLGLFHHPNPTAAGIVATAERERITRFVEKPPPDQIFSDLANAGVYVLDPAILSAIPETIPLDFGHDIFPRLLAQGAPLYGTALGGYLQDTGRPDQYRQANWDVLEGRVHTPPAHSALWIGADVRLGQNIALHGRNIIGNGAVIEDNVTLTDCILWDNVFIGQGASLNRAILANNVTIAPNIILPASLILGEHTRFDETGT